MIKVVMAKTVVDLMEVHSREVSRAVRDALHLLERRIEGYGGIIALNCEGHVAVAYNTPRMARAYLTSDMAAPFVGVG
jgi:beta-aspartyl-peptidase (threonine type)